MKGTVKTWLKDRGYGFEPVDGGEDIFVHWSDIHGAYEMKEDQIVKFEVQSTNKGPRAVNVKFIE